MFDFALIHKKMEEIKKERWVKASVCSLQSKSGALLELPSLNVDQSGAEGRSPVHCGGLCDITEGHCPQPTVFTPKQAAAEKDEPSSLPVGNTGRGKNVSRRLLVEKLGTNVEDREACR